MEQIDYDVDEFIDYCTSKNLSTKTIGSYEQTLRLLAQYLKDNYKVKSAGDTKELHIREYIKYLKERGKRPANGRFAALIFFLVKCVVDVIGVEKFRQGDADRVAQKF